MRIDVFFQVSPSQRTNSAVAQLCATQRLQSMDKSIGTISNNIDKLMAYMAYENEQRAEMLEWLQALRALYKMLRSNPQLDPKTGQFLPESRKEHKRARTIEQKKKVISAAQLQEEVNFDESLLEDDLQTTLHWGQSLSLRAQDRAVNIIQSPKLKDWLLSTTNSILLINGNAPDLDANVHATSFLSAHLVNSIAGTKKNMLCICWFCSLHRNVRNDADASVASIVCSMIGQLLSKYRDFDLTFFHKRHLHGVRDKDLTTLCNVLDELILQLPNGTVLFCVLDWLSCIEDATRRDDVRYDVASGQSRGDRGGGHHEQRIESQREPRDDDENSDEWQHGRRRDQSWSMV